MTFSQEDKKFLTLVVVIAVIIAALPFVYAVLTTPEGMVYSGRHWQNSGDYAVYFSQMEQARQGHVLFFDLFTSENHPRAIFNPIWLVLGWISRITGLFVPLTFHISRLMVIPLFLVVAARFVWTMLDDALERRVALLLISFGGGIAGYAQTTDASAFHAMQFSPHLVLSLTVLLAIFLLMYQSFSRHSLRPAVFAGFLGLVLFFFHPYHISTTYGILGVYTLVMVIRQRQFAWHFIASFCTYIALSAPAVLYYWLFFKYSPIGNGWLVQSDLLMHARPPWELLLAFAPLVLLAVVGYKVLVARRREQAIFMMIWVITALILMWVPWFFRMRTIGGMTIPLSIAAAAGIVWLFRHAPYGKPIIVWSSGLIVVVIVGTAPVHLGTLAKNISIYADRVDYAYLSEEFIDVAQTYKQQATDADVLLASPYTSNIIPALTGKRVYIGHGIQTLSSQQKVNDIIAFFSRAANDSPTHEELRSRGITFLLITPEERELGAHPLENASFLDMVAQEGPYSLYRVR